MKGREGCQKQGGILHARKHAHHILQQIRLGVDVVILHANLRHHLPLTPQFRPHLVERRVSLQLRRVLVLQQIEHGGRVPLPLTSHSHHPPTESGAGSRRSGPAATSSVRSPAPCGCECRCRTRLRHADSASMPTYVLIIANRGYHRMGRVMNKSISLGYPSFDHSTTISA